MVGWSNGRLVNISSDQMVVWANGRMVKLLYDRQRYDDQMVGWWAFLKVKWWDGESHYEESK